MRLRLLFVVSIFLAVFLIGVVSAVAPYGATVNHVKTESALPDSPGNRTAYAGNVTELTLYAYTTTQSWQGYFGNVSGTIQLADASDNIMYNWSVLSPEGEVYAANRTITWGHIQCFNFTSVGTYASDSGQAGGTSRYGRNLSQIEVAYNITWDDKDGVNETFFRNNAHDLFYTNNLQFSPGECLSARIFDNTGQGVDNHYEEVLLYDPDNRAVVFAALLEEDSPLGFDDERHDFEMLVLENGHGTDISPTTYYFYVELE